MAVLVVAILLVARVVLGMLLITRAPGVVDLGETAVSMERTGRAVRILVAAGDPVLEGTPLAEVTVLEEETAAEAARQQVQRLDRDIEAERRRAHAVADEQASRDRATAADLRDEGLRARGEVGQIDSEAAGLARQLEEIGAEAAAQERLEREGVVSRSAAMGIQIQRLEVQARREGLLERQRWLARTSEQLLSTAESLDARADAAEGEALARSDVAFLQARAAEVEEQAARHAALARPLVVSPGAAVISWIDARPGEVVQAGQPLLRLVPEGTGTVVAWPEDPDAFPPGARVRVTGVAFRATGTVERMLDADRAKPTPLLRPYQREAVGPAILVRLDEVRDGAPRAGSVVRVSRPRMGWLARLALGAAPDAAQLAAR